MKMHVKDLQKEIINKVKQVSKLVQVKDGDYEKASKEQNLQIDNLLAEGKKISKYIPKIEAEEKELELLDNTPDQHDDELTELVDQVKSSVKAIRKDLLSKQTAQKKQDLVDKEKAEEAEYAYTPKEGFNWDNVSASIGDAMAESPLAI